MILMNQINHVYSAPASLDGVAERVAAHYTTQVYGSGFVVAYGPDITPRNGSKTPLLELQYYELKRAIVPSSEASGWEVNPRFWDTAPYLLVRELYPRWVDETLAPGYGRDMGNLLLGRVRAEIERRWPQGAPSPPVEALPRFERPELV